MRKDVNFYIDSGVYQQPTDRTKLENFIEIVQVRTLGSCFIHDTKSSTQCRHTEQLF